MQTSFTPAQLADPAMASSEKILRSCVHCGFCTATCPTYLLLGDELDSPARAHLSHQGHARGRQAGLARGRHAHRPLPLLPLLHDDVPVAACITCISSIMRAPISRRRYRRSFGDRLLRALLAAYLPHRGAFPVGAHGRAASARPLAGVVARIPLLGARLAAMLELAPSAFRRGAAAARPRRLPAAAQPQGARRAARRLRPAGAQAVDQRGDDPALEPARRRGRAAARRGLLRRARASHGPGGRAPTPSRRATSRPGTRRSRRAGSMRS